MANLLEIVSLVKNFGGLTALNHINLKISKGMIAGLIGPNGAGKTTLFDCLTGIHKADRGRIFLQGKDICGLQSHRITALGMARTFQNIRLFNQLTVLENILVGLHCRLPSGLWGDIFRNRKTVGSEKEAFEKGMHLLHLVGLQEKADLPAAHLAYGDQRKLEIARALASEPRLLLLDEPTAGMNPKETKALTRFIEEIHLKKNLTILLIEHDMSVVMNISDRIIVLDYGTKIAEGSPSEIRKNARVVMAYLGREPEDA